MTRAELRENSGSPDHQCGNGSIRNAVAFFNPRSLASRWTVCPYFARDPIFVKFNENDQTQYLRTALRPGFEMDPGKDFDSSEFGYRISEISAGPQVAETRCFCFRYSKRAPGLSLLTHGIRSFRQTFCDAEMLALEKSAFLPFSLRSHRSYPPFQFATCAFFAPARPLSLRSAQQLLRVWGEKRRRHA